MTVYRYKAVGKGGVLVKGSLEAGSVAELYTHLQALSLLPIACTPLRKWPGFERSIRVRSLRELCLHLEQCEKAGIPLTDSLEEIAALQDIPKLKSILQELRKDLEAGALLSTALEKYPRVFDAVFIGVIRVGEKTGKLSVAFQQLAQHLKWVDDVQVQIVKSLRYPLIMVILLCAVFYTLLTIVVPELVGFIQGASDQLPFSTRLLLATSSFLSRYFLVLLTMGSVSFTLLAAVLKLHPQWRSRLQAALPLVGPLHLQLALTRFCHLFALLFGSAIDVLQALQTARDSLGPGVLPHALRRVEYLVREGYSLSRAFEKTEAFPPMVVRMMRMGEQTSSLAETLLHVKDYVETMFKRRVDHLIGLIEPTTILLMGLLMGWVVYAIFIPLYDTLMILDC